MLLRTAENFTDRVLASIFPWPCLVQFRLSLNLVRVTPYPIVTLDAQSHWPLCYSELVSATGPLHWWFPPPGMLFPWSLQVSAPVFLIKLSLASPSRSLYCSLCHILIYGPYGFCYNLQLRLCIGCCHTFPLLQCQPCEGRTFHFFCSALTPSITLAHNRCSLSLLNE